MEVTTLGIDLPKCGSRVPRKALRLPLGASYHGHGSEELTGWQVAMALMESTLAQWFFHVFFPENMGDVL